MAVGVLLGALGVPAAAAADAPGMLRIAHLSPDTPAVDVALAPLPTDGGPRVTDPGPDLAAGLTYGAVSSYTEVAPGSYAVSLRAAGAGAGTPPVLTARVDVPGGQARTVAISGLFADLALRPLTDDLSAPPDGAARVRVLSAAHGVRSVDVGLDGGPALATALTADEQADAVVVAAGATRMWVDGAPGDATALPLTWAPGSISTVLVLDTPGGGLAVRVVLDAAGPAVVPVGPVEAGGGGAAEPASALGWVLGAAAAVGAVSRRGRVAAVVAGAVLAAVPALPAPPSQEVPTPPVTLAAAASLDGPPPLRLQVPSVGIDTALTGIDLGPAGALVPPADGSLAGWYRQGPAPGAPGPAVLTGHVDNVAGPAVFFRLRDVVPGDRVTVQRADGTTAGFTVTRVARYPKDAFPTAEVYGPTPDAELRLITCGGAFDRAARSYLDDVVVYATLG